MPGRHLAIGLLGVILVGGACSSTGPENPDDAVLLADLRIDGVRHDFSVFPNQQGPDAPCVGVSLSDDEGATVIMACPTEATETGEYAAVLELDTGSFVVGYGLEPGEAITTRAATGIAIAEDPDGHPFFVIRLRQSPGLHAVELVITTATGGVRTITAHGSQ